jgi:CRISPR/Cas system-associated exonuclease Cas4 (RecB family)
MVVTDWKTGKFRAEINDDYIEQLELYALAALRLHPHLKEVRPRLVYIDVGLIFPAVDNPIVFTQADVPKLKKLWEKRTKPMMSDTTFAPRPNDKCKWCHFRKSSGGPCKF